MFIIYLICGASDPNILLCMFYACSFKNKVLTIARLTISFCRTFQHIIVQIQSDSCKLSVL